MKIKIGDEIDTVIGKIKVIGLFRDANQTEYIKYKNGEKEVFEYLFEFKKRLHKPLDDLEL
jgi:hypothetical protein